MIDDPKRYGSLDSKFDPENDVVLQLKYVSDLVKQVWRELGYFDYEEKPDDIEGILEYRPEHKYDSGDIYIGQFLKGTNIRHGKGVIIYKTGSVEASWYKNNKSNGKSRLIFCTGNAYEGP